MMTKLPRHVNIDYKKITDLQKDLIYYNVVLTELDVLLEESDKLKKSKERIRKYIIIDLVTLTEDNAKRYTRWLIDNRNLDVSSLIKINDTNQRYSMGSIVATNFNFQSIYELNLVYSKLLNIDFLDIIRKFISSDDFDILCKLTVFRDSTALKNNWMGFLKMFEMRHQVVHNMKNAASFVPASPISRPTWHDEISEFSDEYIKHMICSTEVFLFLCNRLPQSILEHRAGRYIFPEQSFLDSYFGSCLEKNCEK